MTPATVRNAAQDLATKVEVEKLRRETTAKIEQLGLQTNVDITKARADADIAEAKADLMKWIVSGIMYTTAVLLIVVILAAAD